MLNPRSQMINRSEYRLLLLALVLILFESMYWHKALAADSGNPNLLAPLEKTSGRYFVPTDVPCPDMQSKHVNSRLADGLYDIVGIAAVHEDDISTESPYYNWNRSGVDLFLISAAGELYSARFGSYLCIAKTSTCGGVNQTIFQEIVSTQPSVASTFVSAIRTKSYSVVVPKQLPLTEALSFVPTAQKYNKDAWVGDYIQDLMSGYTSALQVWRFKTPNWSPDILFRNYQGGSILVRKGKLLQEMPLFVEAKPILGLIKSNYDLHILWNNHTSSYSTNITTPRAQDFNDDEELQVWTDWNASSPDESCGDD